MTVRASGSASALIALTALAQLCLGRRLSANWRFALWLPVVVRLLAPALPESGWSLFNVRHWFAMAEQPPVVAGAGPRAMTQSEIPAASESEVSEFPETLRLKTIA